MFVNFFASPATNNACIENNEHDCQTQLASYPLSFRWHQHTTEYKITAISTGGSVFIRLSGKFFKCPWEFKARAKCVVLKIVSTTSIIHTNIINYCNILAIALLLKNDT